mmetsp:Transcript_12319/g.25518  ORF Transcript_12319/g.25518 Transcript_12319/m.25518 type:complete len:239 (-) Transcript_12319:122-838(-)
MCYCFDYPQRMDSQGHVASPLLSEEQVQPAHLRPHPQEMLPLADENNVEEETFHLYHSAPPREGGLSQHHHNLYWNSPRVDTYDYLWTAQQSQDEPLLDKSPVPGFWTSVCSALWIFSFEVLIVTYIICLHLCNQRGYALWQFLYTTVWGGISNDTKEQQEQRLAEDYEPLYHCDQHPLPPYPASATSNSNSKSSREDPSNMNNNPPNNGIFHYCTNLTSLRYSDYDLLSLLLVLYSS